MRIILALILTLFIVFPSFADEVEYEVKFTVVYNSVPIDEATKIIEEVMSKHHAACKVDVDISKPNAPGGWVVYNDGSHFVELENDGGISYNNA